MPVTRVVNLKSIIMAKAKKTKEAIPEVVPALSDEEVTQMFHDELEGKENIEEEEIVDEQKWDERLDTNPNDQQKNERL